MWKATLLLVIFSFSSAYDKFHVTRYEERDFFDDPKKYGHEPWRFVRFGYGIGYGIKDPGVAYERGYGFVRGLGRDICPEHLEKCNSDGRYKHRFRYIGRNEPYFGWRPSGTAAADIAKDPYRKANIVASHYLQGPH